MIFNCPICTGSIEIDDVHGGSEMQCPDCGGFIVAPEAPPVQAASLQMQPVGHVEDGVQKVIITDFKIPFTSVARLLLQVMLFALIAGTILFSILGILSLLLFGGCASLLNY